MSFKIKNNIIDLQSITNSPLDFNDTITPYARGMNTSTSFTDDQHFLRCKKAVAVISSNLTEHQTATTCNGLTKRKYRAGTGAYSNNGYKRVESWNQNNVVYFNPFSVEELNNILGDLTSNFGNNIYPANYGAGASGAYRCGTSYCGRCYWNTDMYNRTYFLRYCNYNSDGCLKYILVG